MAVGSQFREILRNAILRIEVQLCLKWWEKTVEYKFVMDVADEGSLILAPLDGDHEKVADTAIGNSELWLMIEFKFKRKGKNHG